MVSCISSLFQPIKVKPFSPISFNNKKSKNNKVGGLFQPIPPSKKTKGLFQPVKMTPIKITPINNSKPKNLIFGFDIPKNKRKVKGKKSLSWNQAKAKFPKMSPFGDADKDGVKNWLDCRPFDKKRQALKKPDKNKPAWKMMPKSWEKIKQDKCPTCPKDIKEKDFTSPLSKKEYSISGMCQDCQDDTFGAAPYPLKNANPIIKRGGEKYEMIKLGGESNQEKYEKQLKSNQKKFEVTGTEVNPYGTHTMQEWVEAKNKKEAKIKAIKRHEADIIPEDVGKQTYEDVKITKLTDNEYEDIKENRRKTFQESPEVTYGPNWKKEMPIEPNETLSDYKKRAYTDDPEGFKEFKEEHMERMKNYPKSHEQVYGEPLTGEKKKQWEEQYNNLKNEIVIEDVYDENRDEKFSDHRQMTVEDAGMEAPDDIDDEDESSARDAARDEVLNILERKDRERTAEIKRIKNLEGVPEWERKMMLKAVKSSTWGW